MKDVEIAVRDRYGAAAQLKEEALCCPVEYDPQYLRVLPDEIVERDYGCGDPSRFVRSGETVLDLGSGGGKICYIASQIVGESWSVIGVSRILKCWLWQTNTASRWRRKMVSPTRNFVTAGFRI